MENVFLTLERLYNMDQFAQDIYETLETQSQPNTIVVKPSNLFYNFSGNEITLPESIIMPDAHGRSKTPYATLYNRLGFRYNSGLTIRELDQSLRDRLSTLGYIPSANDIRLMVRSSPLRIVRQESHQADIALPNEIPESVLHSMDSLLAFFDRYQVPIVQDRKKPITMRNEFSSYLSRNGYLYDVRRKALIKSSVVISSEPLINTKRCIDLVTPEIIIQRATQPVTLTADNLWAVNISEHEMESMVQDRSSIQTILQTLYIKLGVPPETMLFILCLYVLSNLPIDQISTIYRALDLTSPTNATTIDKLNAIRAQFQSQLTPAESIRYRTYQARTTVPTGPKPNDFQQAVIEGYSVLDNPTFMGQYRNDLIMNNDDQAVIYWARLLQAYPEMAVRFFETLKKPKQSLVMETIRLIYKDQKINRVQELYTLMTGAPLRIPLDVEAEDRLAKISRLTPAYLSVLSSLYNGQTDPKEIVKLKKNPLEDVFLKMVFSPSDKVIEVAASIGMVIPERLSSITPRQYFFLRLLEYLPVIMRSSGPPLDTIIKNEISTNDLSRYTDQEILAVIGNREFSSRNDLISKALTAINNKTFFLLNEIDKNRAINQMTILYEDISELEPPYLVFGSVLRYRVYTLDELNGAWYPEVPQDPASIMFRKPEETAVYFNEEAITSLKALLFQISSIPSELLLDKIIIGSAARDIRNRAALNFKDLLRRINTTPFKKIFEDIFYMAMYMRRWQGPGHSFPLKERETINRPNPDTRAGMIAYRLFQEFETIPDEIIEKFGELRCLVLSDSRGRFAYINQRLGDILAKVYVGEYCIRMASKMLVITSYYYLMIFFNERIGGIAPEEMDEIQ